VASKYVNVIDKLPRMLATEPAYQEKVEEAKAKLVTELNIELKASVLAREYASLRAERDRIEDELSDVNLNLEAVSQLLIAQYETEGTTSVRLATGQTIRMQIEPYAQVQDREQYRLWCIANGLERSMMLPWQTTNSLVKERLLAGEVEPDGVIATARTKIVLQKA